MSTSSETPSLWLRMPPPIWAAAMFVAALLFDRIFDWSVLMRITSTPLAVILGLGGFGLALWARLIFFTEETEVMPTSKANAKFVTHGAFRLNRNPMYSGIIALTLGIAFYFGTLPYFAVPVGLFFLCDRVFVPFEEEKMVRQFGQPYEEYRTRVRRWI